MKAMQAEPIARFNQAPRRVYNAELRRQIAAKVQQCTRWLRISGYEVVEVAGGLRQPRVVIKHSPLCNRLEGAAEAYERTPRGGRRYRYVVRFDCMVEWEKSEANHAGQ